MNRNTTENLTKLQFARRIAGAFPGFLGDTDVSGAELVNWVNEHMAELKLVEGGTAYKQLRKRLPGFKNGGDVNRCDLVDWVNEAFGEQFRIVALEPRMYQGTWSHLFGPGRAETQCRIVVDVANDKLVAAQASDGPKWVDLSAADMSDLAASLFDANDVSDDPKEWDLAPIAELPEWASPREIDPNHAEIAAELHRLRSVAPGWRPETLRESAIDTFSMKWGMTRDEVQEIVDSFLAKSGAAHAAHVLVPNL
ncbi:MULTISPECIES: hypothetical protein [unclassified Cupriavidus]|uniref:hypothetical protein n=1 Tax=unclassified Cupriavidus TaxID=2640874 RepID=UPI001AE7ED7B|nr:MULTISPECIES: hypothetical protein [unclassified Cupriavidus]MBP0633175.1 hypothetical protein [Cupriavidus sp. AcVe19-1a]MBP0639636.1 hypothetical protein [Cupriavidus sp. AcVe19-6a]